MKSQFIYFKKGINTFPLKKSNKTCLKISIKSNFKIKQIYNSLLNHVTKYKK